MADIQMFDFNGAEIRVVIIDGDPWFIAKDIYSVLELDHTSLRRLKDYEKGVESIPTLGGDQEMATISESGLYRLVLTSRKPQAEFFQDWVCQKVLPSIRKTGSYHNKPMTLAETILAQAQLLVKLEQEQNRQNQKQLELEAAQKQTNTQVQKHEEDISTIKSQILDIKNLVANIKEVQDLQSQRNILVEFMQKFGALIAVKENIPIHTAMRKAWSNLSLKLRNSKYRFDLNARKANADKKYKEICKTTPEADKPKALNRVDILVNSEMLEAALEVCCSIANELN
jgi:anti-repressor protein